LNWTATRGNHLFFNEETSSVDFKEPGGKWKESSLQKLNLLLSIGRDLQAEGLIPQRVTFSSLMEHVAGTEELEFGSRVFLFVLGVIVYQLSSFCGMVNILEHLERNEMLTPATIIEEEEKEDSNSLATIIGNIDDDARPMAATILNVCKELVKAPCNGAVPSTLDGLKAIGLTDDLSNTVLQCVFGSTGLHCGLNLRKLVVAADFFDWEHAGVASKLDIKLTKVPALHVQKSLLTWIPLGQRLVLQDTQEELAFVIGSNKQGFWGKYKKAAKRHDAADKKILMDMATDICCFYKAIKGGGKANR